MGVGHRLWHRLWHSGLGGKTYSALWPAASHPVCSTKWESSETTTHCYQHRSEKIPLQSEKSEKIAFFPSPPNWMWVHDKNWCFDLGGHNTSGLLNCIMEKMSPVCQKGELEKVAKIVHIALRKIQIGKHNFVYIVLKEIQIQIERNPKWQR